MTTCYECEQEVPKLVWKSRCQQCVDIRIAANRKYISDGIAVEAAKEALEELLEASNEQLNYNPNT